MDSNNTGTVTQVMDHVSAGRRMLSSHRRGGHPLAPQTVVATGFTLRFACHRRRICVRLRGESAVPHEGVGLPSPPLSPARTGVFALLVFMGTVKPCRYAAVSPMCRPLQTAAAHLVKRTSLTLRGTGRTGFTPEQHQTVAKIVAFLRRQ